MKRQKRNKTDLMIKVGVIIVIMLILGGSYFFKDSIEKFLNPNFKEEYFSEVINENGLEIHFIDVGQGDAIAIKFPDKKTMLVDSGPGESKNKLNSYLQNTFFKTSKKEFDYFLLTHKDEDHIGGAPTVFENFQVNLTYLPFMYTTEQADVLKQNGVAVDNKQICDTKIFKRTMDLAFAEPDCVIERSFVGDKIEGEGYLLEFLSPFSEIIAKANNYSPIIMLEYSGKKVMLTGDAEKEVEKEVLNFYSPNKLRADILKVGHHGSTTSSTQEFLNTVSPAFSVISCGEGNSYGHPNQETLTKLESVNSKVFRTDLSGSIVCGIFDGKIVFNAIGSGGEFYISWFMVLGAGAIICVIVLFVPIKVKRKSN